MTVVPLKRKPAAEPAAADIGNPLKKRSQIRVVDVLEDVAHPAHHHWRRNILICLAAILSVIGAYLGAMGASNRIGDDLQYPSARDLRENWAAPWAGVCAMILRHEADSNGWSPDAADWSPQGQLTAMPVYQSALAAGVGEFAALMAAQMGTEDVPDPDLDAAARLLEGAVNATEIRAASDAFGSFDGRMKRYRVETAMSDADQIVGQLSLFVKWAEASSEELRSVHLLASGWPLDDDSVVAFYRARARGYLAHRLIDAMDLSGARASPGRAAALSAWRRVAEFEPLFVMNGSPDGVLFTSHAAAMNLRLADAIAATRAYMDGSGGDSSAQAPEKTS